ncbi:phage holin family protein [Pseudomonas cremoricolorata]|uniref:Uncharacterized protein n=1 Tax=Pseudomonas cremoricolorata TaxID=157783 RepID=A0A089YFK3_9PSED|nr:phage holin family protein [Pseudomonas cremoricolorata]AIR90513.1 hypothetical protein LK03_15010 [Pseudomonas cremoricolorata]
MDNISYALTMAGVYFHAFAMWLDGVIPDALLTIRGSCHFLIFLAVAGYRKATGKHRRVIGGIAFAFAGANFTESIRVIYKFNEFSSVVQPPLTIIMLCILFFVLYARGNMARLLPPRLSDMLR